MSISIDNSEKKFIIIVVNIWIINFSKDLFRLMGCSSWLAHDSELNIKAEK